MGCRMPNNYHAVDIKPKGVMNFIFKGQEIRRKEDSKDKTEMGE